MKNKLVILPCIILASVAAILVLRLPSSPQDEGQHSIHPPGKATDPVSPVAISSAKKDSNTAAGTRKESPLASTVNIFDKYHVNSVQGLPQEGKKELYEQHVTKEYDSFLRELNLPDTTLSRIEALLAEYFIVVYDVQSIAHAEKRGFTEREVRAAQSEVMQNIKALVDPDTFAIIDKMIETGQAFKSVNEKYAPAMALAGSPLTPGNKVALAEIIHETYNVDTKRNENAFVINENGLSKLDEQTLAKTNTFLTEPQRRIMERYLIERTSAFIKSTHFIAKTK